MADDSDDKKDLTRKQKAVVSAVRSMRDAGERMAEGAASESLSRSNVQNPNTEVRMQSYKRGGKVRKTGLARLHKGEKVVKRKRKRMSGRY